MKNKVVNNTVSFIKELWNNKILSLFYLIVFGANVFNLANDWLGLKDFWQKIVIALALPIALVFLLTLLVAFIFEKFKKNRIVKIIKEATREFFQIFEEDSYEDSVKSVKITMKQRAYYIIMDYWAVFGAIFVVAIFNYFNRGFIEVVIATVTYDFLIAWGFMIYSLKTGNDVTFGEGYRRAIDVIHRESRILGYFGMIALNLKATIWDGPEQVPIFFKKEIGGFGKMSVVLLFLSIIQGLFWAWLYSYGYDSIFEVLDVTI